MTTNPLAELSAAGVAIWLDDLSRNRIESGQLAELISKKHVVGVTTNPTIFAAALAQGTAYNTQLKELASQGVDAEGASIIIPTDDVRSACDVFRPVYEASGGVDGRVSIEVDPRLAHKRDETVAQAKQLHELVGRPNVMIKIPATDEGLTAITAATAAGISVNVTLIFSASRNQQVMDSYLTGLEQAAAAGIDLSTIHSVASVFVSRVDSKVDPQLDAMGTSQAAALRGKAAIANSVLMYHDFLATFSSDRWAALAAKGANLQRPLWASTGVKDPAYSDTLYVEALVGPDTVNTMPEATLLAVDDHGAITPNTLFAAQSAAEQTVAELAALGIDLEAVAQELEAEGVDKFIISWQELLDTLAAGIAKAS